MNRRYVTVDVFTSTKFQGNPVAVVLDAIGLSTQQMQTIAAEFAYTETTFVLPPQDPTHTAWVRIFTPNREIPFAGHPNIGTAFALATYAASSNTPLPDRLIFEEAAGLVQVTLLKDRFTVVGAELIAPEKLSRRTEVRPDLVAACLSLDTEDIQIDAHKPQVVSVGLPFLIAELSSRDALRRCIPNPAVFKKVLPLDGATSIYVYTRDTEKYSAECDCDLQARMFTARMTEDPATGSATAATLALLADIQGAAELALYVKQGVDMGRPSILLARMETLDGLAMVHIGGKCIMVMEGVFQIVGET